MTQYHSDADRAIAESAFEGDDPKVEEDGDFLVQVKMVTRSRSGRPGMTQLQKWVISYIVLDSGGAEKHPAGSHRAWIAWPERSKKAAASIKSFILACEGVDIARHKDPLTAEKMAGVYGEDQTLSGCVVRLVTQHIPECASGFPFTVHRWYPAQEGQRVCAKAPAASGWQLHPDDPSYAWNPATNEVRPRGEVGL